MANEKVWVAIITISVVISLATLVTVPVLRERRNSDIQDYGTQQYAILIDAGSSGSRLSVFTWDRNTRLLKGSGVISQVGESCSNSSARGISEYAIPADAAQSLVGCLNEAIEIVPSTHHHLTPLYLAATAGMRLLQEKNATQADAILDAILDLFDAYPFQQDDTDEKHARIITGVEEGLFGWITVNYLLGLIDPDKNPEPVRTAGALDLGGASTQISFVPYNGSNGEFENSSLFYSNVTAYDRSYVAYSHSFLCYGLNEARRRYQGNLVQVANYSSVVEDPCGLRGDVVNVTGEFLWLPPCSSGHEAITAWGDILHKPDLSRLAKSAYDRVNMLGAAEDANFQLLGTGNSSECRRLVDQMFDNTECTYPSCSFNGAYQPSLADNDFIAFAGYFYQAEPMNVTGPVPLGKLVNATDMVCRMTLEEVLQLPSIRAEFASRYCFAFKYAVSLLTDGFGFSLDAVIDVRDDINGTDTGWALGYVIHASSVVPVDFGPQAFLSTTSYAFLLAASALLILLTIPCVVRVYRRRRMAKAGFVRIPGQDHSQYVPVA
ncbi:ectonucleoside triphosphate diphosphohydrolase 1-like isoform X1 [Sycon ciliatum]|uniref:ectonucleoside triphosphate diphosphohydrolase 1-like isoform X1 n=1 Tax=Sycon ciliatum TaxID=27933 RepID=UPI0031F609D6